MRWAVGHIRDDPCAMGSTNLDRCAYVRATCLKIEAFFGSQKVVNSKGTWEEISGTMKENYA